MDTSNKILLYDRHEIRGGKLNSEHDINEKGEGNSLKKEGQEV